jgi:hypothetical protein
LLGFVPPRIEARIAVTGALDPKLLELQENLRSTASPPAVPGRPGRKCRR